MKIINPTESKIEVVIKGTKYSIDASGELKNISREHAEHWKSHIHEFLLLEEEGAEELEKVEIVHEEIEGDEVEEVEIDLNELTRPQLDEIAVQFELDPKDYKNKIELIEALSVKE